MLKFVLAAVLGLAILAPAGVAEASHHQATAKLVKATKKHHKKHHKKHKKAVKKAMLKTA